MQRSEKLGNKSIKMMMWTESRCSLDMSTLSNLWIKFNSQVRLIMKLMKTFSFLSESMENGVIENKFSFSTTINKKIYILIIIKQKTKIMKLNYRCHYNI